MKLNLLCTCAIVLGLVAGCSWESGPDLHQVTGTITKDGVPFVGASLEFYPEGPGAPSYGESDEEGNFRLRYSTGRDGAIEGDHLVTVIGGKLKEGAEPIVRQDKGRETLTEGDAAPDQLVANPDAKPRRRSGGGPPTIEGIPALVSPDNDNHVTIEL